MERSEPNCAQSRDHQASFSLESLHRNHSRAELGPRNLAGAYLIVLLLVVIWISGALIAPVGMARGWISQDRFPALSGGPHWLPDLLAVVIHGAYGKVCHQIPERCLSIEGHPMAVCARCFGIYAGFLGGLLIYPLARVRLGVGLPRRRWLVLALLPLAIDFAGGYFGLIENTLASRTLTGALAGMAGAIYAATGLIAVTGATLGAVAAWRNSLPLNQRGGAHNV